MQMCVCLFGGFVLPEKKLRDNEFFLSLGMYKHSILTLEIFTDLQPDSRPDQ